jgi:hypothetical protein
VEAAVEAAEKEIDGRCIHYQSQPGRLPQSRFYKSLYLTQEPPALTL